MEGKEAKTEADKNAYSEGQHQESTVQRWSDAGRSAGQNVIDRYWPNIIITILGVLILTPVAGALMSSPRTIIIGIATGLTLIVWLAAYQIDKHLRTPPEKPSPSTLDVPASKEDIAEVKRQLAELYEHLKPSAEKITKKYPGISVQGILSLHALKENRRKYLFDFGQLNKDRFSIYLDPDNVLTLAIVSASSEPYSVRIAPSDVPLDRFFYLSCEVAIADKSTALRMLINGNLVGALDLPFKIDPGKFDLTGGVVGADLDGNNGARFDLAEVLMYSTTLTSEELNQTLQYFSSNPTSKYVQFSGNQWMRHVGKGIGLRQDIPEAKPIFRNLDEPKPLTSSSPEK